MQPGIISKTYGTVYGVIPENQPRIEYLATLRGRLRLRLRHLYNKKKFSHHRHLLTIGDRVLFSQSEGTKQGPGTTNYFIEDVLERRNAIERSSRHQTHCLGANVERVLIVVSMVEPLPHFGFLDRFLCAAYAGGLEAWIVFSKIDLLHQKKQETKLSPRTKVLVKLETFPGLYESLGYTVFVLNLLAKPEVDRLKEKLGLGTTLIIGQSGVGKSTLLNHFLGREAQQTNVTSPSTGQGRHTTTNSSLFVCPITDAFFIDTPGLREWGLYSLEDHLVMQAFPEIRNYMAEVPCRFSDCTHTPTSQGCSLHQFFGLSSKSKVEKEADAVSGFIHPSRLWSLQSILASDRKGCFARQ